MRGSEMAARMKKHTAIKPRYRQILNMLHTLPIGVRRRCLHRISEQVEAGDDGRVILNGGGLSAIQRVRSLRIVRSLVCEWNTRYATRTL
jgi:hypothetical protein